MRRAVARHVIALTLIALLCTTTLSPIITTFDSTTDVNETSKNSQNSADVPTWRIGDKWKYAGAFDPTQLVIDAGVEATVGEINGDAMAEVLSITEQNVDGQNTMVYTLRTSANFDKSGVSLEGFTGTAEIEFTQTEIRRVSDLSLVRSDLDLYIEFTPSGISFLRQILGDITITNSYSPSSEDYDFPIRADERWTTTVTSSSQWSGASDYITPFPPPTSDTNDTTYEVTNTGKPLNDYGQGINYAGCDDSFEITSFNSAGDEEGYTWYCPAAKNFAWKHSEDDVGLVIDFRLKEYYPKDSTGVDVYSDPGTRDECLEIEFTNDITALDTPTDVWVNASSSQGCFSNSAGVNLEVRHEASGFTQQLTTANNGSAWTQFDIGNAVDGSDTSIDWASHGIIARSLTGTTLVGSKTITLDEELVALDLFADAERALITRTRDGVDRELNALSGYDVLPGDDLTIEVVIQNKGITSSQPTDLRIYPPIGQSFDIPMPSLGTYQTFKTNFTWTVPDSQAIGIVPISWEVDPNQVNTADVNSDNDYAIIGLFVGRLPTPVIVDAQAKTLEEVFINASYSFDEDGGNVTCLFEIPYDDGSRTWAWEKVLSDSCMTNWTWTDDGSYPILVTITDEERDETQVTLLAEIENRAPKLELRSLRTEARVEHPITLYAFANDSDSEDVWPGVVDVFWPTAQCQEGYYTRVCTTTAPTEGWHTFTAIGTDDDSSSTTATIDIKFTNIAPHSTIINLYNDSGTIPSDEQKIWQLDEDQVVLVKGQAEDSIDDIETLSHTWWPDDKQGSLIYFLEGRVTQFEMSWQTSGLHTIRLDVTDSDGATSNTNERWVNIRNVPPVIQPLDSFLPLAEGEPITIVGNSTDTISDIPTLVKCWDVDPGIDSDNIGGASDDCDIVGDEFTYSWNRSGSHKIVYHVTDDDGATTSEVLTIEVINIPPIVRLKQTSCVAYEGCILDARGTIDSLNDIDTLNIAWDLDVTEDSNGDGIKDNDADLVGSRVEHTFRQDGKITVKAMAYDEDPENPGMAELTINVAPPNRNALEQVSALLAGEDANPLAQVALIIIIILLLVIVAKRRNSSNESKNWQRDGFDDEFGSEEQLEKAQKRKPASPPPGFVFDQAMEIAPNTQNTGDISIEELLKGPPLPDSGLPDGWTMEQWQYYGHEWLKSQ